MQLKRELVTMKWLWKQSVSNVGWRGPTNFDGDLIICDSVKGYIGREGHPGLEGRADWTYQRGKVDRVELDGSDCHGPPEARRLSYLDVLLIVRRRRAPGPTNLLERSTTGSCRGSGRQSGCISLT